MTKRALICLTTSIALLLSFVAWGCAGSGVSTGPAGDPDRVFDREWVLRSMNGQPVGGAERQPGIRFDSGGKVNGFAGCNRFFGSYTQKGGKISIGRLGSTRKMCDRDVMAVEQGFLRSLRGELYPSISDGTLSLCSAGSAGCLIFSAR